MDILSYPSGNFGPRQGHDAPSLIILHHTAMASAEAALARLCDPEPEVSAHYVIGETGRIWQLVDEAHRAWHAGLSYWQGERDINSASIGIELVNPASLAGFPPFAEAQMTALEALLQAIMTRWHIGPDAVLGHSDIAPGRKADPGAKFDWDRLARRDLARRRPAYEASDGGSAAFHEALTSLGYDPDAKAALLDAFRLRWRQSARGLPLQPEDVGLARALAEAASQTASLTT